MTMRRVAHLALLVAAVASTLVGLTPARAASDPIQPGVRISTSSGSCTLNFIYDGTGSLAGRVYGGTAAHCVSGVGQAVRLGSGETFGTVALMGDPNSTAGDYAFIEVHTALHHRVVAAMKGHPSYPRGVTTAAETSVGDLVQLSGYGLGFGLTKPTQEQRVAVVTYDDAEKHEVIAPLIFGDSGGPLVHIPTGKAYGIVSRLCIGLCEEEGPTVEGLLAKAAARGFTVVVRTV